MAHINITTNKKGQLVARIHASTRNTPTGERKTFTKRIYNTEGLPPTKFRKYVERAAIEFEAQIEEACLAEMEPPPDRVPTFAEVMTEWLEGIRNNLSYSYYDHGVRTFNLFMKFLEENRLHKVPISEIKVRDVQKFLNSFALTTYERPATAKLIKDIPPNRINYRELEREGIIDRNTSYSMRKKGTNISLATAQAICNYCHIPFDVYFQANDNHHVYSVTTVKGHRRILRTVFNEAMRYEWIAKNPVASTKIASGTGNFELNPIREKDVFSMRKAQSFLRKLDSEPREFLYKVLPVKFMLLTGVRIAEMNGLRWSEIDFEKRVVHIVRTRRSAKALGGDYEKEPKTKSSKRDIPLPDSLIRDLRELEEWFRIADEDFDFKRDQYYVACNVYRKPVGISTISQWLHAYEKKWGMKNVSCHGLRHTYCSLLLAQNVPIQTVCKYMGHSDSTVTLKVYSHFIPDTAEKAVYVLDSLTL